LTLKKQILTQRRKVRKGKLKAVVKGEKRKGKKGFTQSHKERKETDFSHLDLKH
jgi:hypothetical protein